MTRPHDRDTRPPAGGHHEVIRPLGMAALALTAILSTAPTPEARAQAQNAPLVQVICEVSGGVAKTVRVTYPATAVRNTHVFRPVGGGQNVVFTAPAAPNQVYSFAVPAGQYRLAYGDAGSLGNTPVLTHRNAVIVIPPFTVRGRICQRSQQPSGPVS